MRFDTVCEVKKYNHYHDSRGRFAASGGGGMTASELARSDVLGKYAYLGVRTLTPDENYKPGDICRDSYDWDFEQDRSSYETDNPVSLGGACSIEIKSNPHIDSHQEIESALTEAVQASGAYSGDRKVIIGGDRQTYGNDPGESIIEHAEVLAVLNPQTGKWETAKSTKKPKKTETKEESKKLSTSDVERYKNDLIDQYVQSHPGSSKFSAFPNLPYEQRQKIQALRNYANTGDAKWIDGVDLSDVKIGKSQFDFIQEIESR